MSDYDASLHAFVEALPIPHRDLISARNKTEFDAAFATIVLEAVQRLENGSKYYSSDSEDKLSHTFVGFVNGTNALTVTREEFSNGHVDMTFHAPLCTPVRLVLGEAKIFDYYSWHEKGLFQLIGRYSTGREERGLLLVYDKIRGIKDHFDQLKMKLDEVLPCGQVAPCAGHNAKWSFVTTHKHSSGEELEVWHLGCNLYSE